MRRFFVTLAVAVALVCTCHSDCRNGIGYDCPADCNPVIYDWETHKDSGCCTIVGNTSDGSTYLITGNHQWQDVNYYFCYTDYTCTSWEYYYSYDRCCDATADHTGCLTTTTVERIPTNRALYADQLDADTLRAVLADTRTTPRPLAHDGNASADS